MNKPITSNNPAKPRIMAALKAAHNCTRITNLRQVGVDTYEGNCLVIDRSNPWKRYQDQGRKQVTVKVEA